jgi:hypothetical protein
MESDRRTSGRSEFFSNVDRGNTTLVVRNRYTSLRSQRLLVMAVIVAILVIACLVTGGRLPLNRSSLQDLPYVLLLLAFLWGRTRIYVCFCGNRVSNGLLLSRDQFLFSRSWNLSEFETITLDVESRMCEFEFAGKKWYAPRLLISVRKDSPDLRSIIKYLSAQVDIEKLDSTIQHMIATSGITGSPPS